ncbi:MAG: DUF1572 family protein [Bacilli bacterium]
MGIAAEYLRCAREAFEGARRLGDRAMEQLDYDELHYAPNDECNSMAIIVKHMAGNMRSRWIDFLTSDGEKPNRNRDAEFEGGYASREELLQDWNSGWQAVFDAIDRLVEDDLMKTVYIRAQAHSVIQAIERQTSHYAQHVGQMVYLGKQIKGSQWRTLSIARGKSLEH